MDTVTVADPDLEVSWVEVAVMLAVPVVAGVKSPLLLIVPIPDGLMDHVTELLKLPVPTTVGVQFEVWLVWIDAGEQARETEAIVLAAFTVTVAEPDFVVSWVDVAVIVAVLAEEGVNTPEALTAPPLADHVTALL